jgi:hypothetical protein
LKPSLHLGGDVPFEVIVFEVVMDRRPHDYALEKGESSVLLDGVQDPVEVPLEGGAGDAPVGFELSSVTRRISSSSNPAVSRKVRKSYFSY